MRPARRLRAYESVNIRGPVSCPGGMAMDKPTPAAAATRHSRMMVTSRPIGSGGISPARARIRLGGQAVAGSAAASGIKTRGHTVLRDCAVPDDELCVEE